MVGCFSPTLESIRMCVKYMCSLQARGLLYTSFFRYIFLSSVSPYQYFTLSLSLSNPSRNDESCWIFKSISSYHENEIRRKNTLLLISNMPNIRAIIGLIESGFCWCYCDCYCSTHSICMCECEYKCACICDVYSIFHQTPRLLLELMCININPSTFSFIRAS